MATSSRVSPARRVAFEILLRVEEGAFASILLNSKTQDLSAPDRALVHELVNGALRRQLWLDHLIQYFSERKPTDLDPGIRIILRLGLYQLRVLSRIPDSAAVNESVNLAKHARLRSATGMVNAVLRRATRERDVDPTAGIEDPVERISIETSHPRWMIERWVSQLGFEDAQKFCRSNNDVPPIAFRVVENRAQPDDIIEELKNAGAVLARSEIAKDAWRVNGATDMVSSMAASGKIYIQDEASQLVSQALDAQPGEVILDLCAAPGSKTTQIAGKTPAATVVASDLYEHRLRTVVSSVPLQGLTNVHVMALDALQELPFNHAFDRVLVDAPCTGTGTLRRNPEIRWRISSSDIVDLSTRQQQILKNASKLVTPGGRLIYSTCSVEPEENEAVQTAFLGNNPSFRPANLDVHESFLTSTSTARTWPHRDGTDGFFIAAFQRT